MAWRTARLVTVLALGGVACGRTELILAVDTEASSSGGGTAGTGATRGLDTGGFDTGGLDTGRPTTGFDTGGPITFTGTFTSGFDTGFDTGVPDSGFDSHLDTGLEETGFPGTTGGPVTSTSETATTTIGTDTDGGTTSVGTTDGGTTDGGTTSVGTTDGGTTSAGTTDGGTTSGGTTAGESTDGGTTDGGGVTCLDAVECVIDCGGASFSCIGQCNDDLSPGDNAAFNDLETCIIFACLFNGSCGFDFDAPECVTCRVDGQNDPAPLGCDDEAALCT